MRIQLLNNGYPNSLISSRLRRMESRIMNQDEEQEPKKRMILPYMGPVTHHLTTYLRRKRNCDFGFIPGKKIGNQICSHKQKEPPKQIGIYKIECATCPSTYIGETSRSVEERVKEHVRDITKKNLKSAVALHIIQNSSHKINQESATLINREPRYFHRKFKEALFIKNTPHRMNRDMGMDINPIWSSLLLPLTSKLIIPPAPRPQRP